MIFLLAESASHHSVVVARPDPLSNFSVQAVKQGPPWAVDAWGVGCLMQEAFSGRQLSRTEDLRDTDPIPKPILQVHIPHSHLA